MTGTCCFVTCLSSLVARINYYNKELAVREQRGERGSITAVGWQLKVIQIEETKIQELYIKYIG